MNTLAQEILKNFDDLPDTEQQVIAAEILKRVINFDVPPLTDKDLVLNAEELFLALDEQNELCNDCPSSPYPLLPQEKGKVPLPFTIDHVVPLAEGSSNDLDNLALACFHCNRRKGCSQAAIDSQSGESVVLYNPRCDQWPKRCIKSQV